MKGFPIKLIAILSVNLILMGCVKVALRFSPSLIPNLTQAFFEECDPDLAKQSLPADLKLMEGLLKNDPCNKQLLTALCMGFTGYAMLFVEEENPERASQLYLRARTYGLKAVDRNTLRLNDSGKKKGAIQTTLLALGKEDLEVLFWITMSWNAWINLNLDKPAALAQLSNAQSCLERVLDIKPDYFYGAPYILMGSILAARPRVLGGNVVEAKKYFDKAMNLSHRKFFLAHYYFARYYAVRTQDKELFLKLIKEVENTSVDELKRVCLINAVIRQKTKHLMQMAEDLFL